jgi:hypothetical protein
MRKKQLSEVVTEVESWLLLGPGVASTLYILSYAWSDPDRVSVVLFGLFAAVVALPSFAGGICLSRRFRRAKWQTFIACCGLWLSLLIAPWPFLMRVNQHRTEFDSLAATLRQGLEPNRLVLRTTGVDSAWLDESGRPVLEVGNGISLRHTLGHLPQENCTAIQDAHALGGGWFWVYED